MQNHEKNIVWLFGVHCTVPDTWTGQGAANDSAICRHDQEK